jgi:hypothetical protein
VRPMCSKYREDVLEMHIDAVSEGARVLIVDDVLATGGLPLPPCGCQSDSAARSPGDGVERAHVSARSGTTGWLRVHASSNTEARWRGGPGRTTSNSGARLAGQGGWPP